MMDDNGIEKKLAENGFTSKEINLIKQWSERDGLTVTDTIKRIKRVFFVANVVILLIILLAISEFFRVSGIEFYSVIFAFLFSILVICFFAPMKLGAKIFLFLKN